MRYPEVHALLVQRGAMERQPDYDDVIAAALDCARAAVMEVYESTGFDAYEDDVPSIHLHHAIAAINDLRGTDG